MTDVDTLNNRSENRYEVYADGELAGSAYYQLEETSIVFTHTEVDDAVEGQGVGSTLAKAALDDVREQGNRRVVAQCQFIKEWIDRHPDYQDLVA